MNGRAPLALGIAALIFGFPIFFDAGLVVFLPIILTVARRFGGSVLYYALPAAGAFAAMHALVPPHPGPVAAGTVLGGDIGVILLVNLPIALVAWYVGVYLVSRQLGARIDVALPTLLFGEINDGGTSGDTAVATKTAPPAFATVLGPARRPVGAHLVQHRPVDPALRRLDRCEPGRRRTDPDRQHPGGSADHAAGGHRPARDPRPDA